MEIASDIRKLDKILKPSCEILLKLESILAKLWRDPRQSDRLVQTGFVAAGDGF
jgi:hypothetical protein